jgi:hypothetical protein
MTHDVMQYLGNVTVKQALLHSLTAGDVLAVLITHSILTDSAKIVGVILWVPKPAPLTVCANAGRTLLESVVTNVNPSTMALTLDSVSPVNVISTVQLLVLNSVTLRATVLVKQDSTGTKLESVMGVLKTNT